MDTHQQAAPPVDRIEPECFMLESLPGHIRSRYGRLALVTSRDHLRFLDPADDETLIVSCDWLLWQKLLAEGRHAVHYELGLLEWTPPHDLDWDLFIRANDWLYEGDRDLTLFRGVSLGKMFAGEISMCLMNYYRLDRAVRGLMERFRPEDILFIDYLNEINVLERPDRTKIVQAACRDLGVRFEVLDPGPETSHISSKIYSAPRESLLKRALLAVYTRGLAAATTLRCLFKDADKRVFVMVNSNLLGPLTEALRSGPMTPVIHCRALPKQIGLIWRCLRHGVLLATPREPALTADDRARLDQIAADVENALGVPRITVPDAVVSHIRAAILNTDRIADAARKIKMAENFFANYRPKRLVVDGIRNAIPHAFIDAAHAQGIAIDYIWHSPLTPNNKRLSAFGGDPRTEPRVSRFLSWGRMADAWAEDIGGAQPRVRVGGPLGHRYAGGPFRNPRPNGRALVLQYTPTVVDLRGLNANAFVHFVTVVRKLRQLGCDDIVMKLHPGPGRWKKTYFEGVAEFFNLGCPVHKTGPYHEHLEKADFVIGPLTSGAMLETLAAGKPYHTFLMKPFGVNPGYYGDFPILSSADELDDAIVRDQTELAQKLLDDFYAFDEVPNGAERFWEALQSGLA